PKSLLWTKVANASFGNLNDGSHLLFRPGNFATAAQRELVFYYAGSPNDRHWWRGAMIGNSLVWKLDGSTRGLGDIGGPGAMVVTGRFDDQSLDRLLVYRKPAAEFNLGSFDLARIPLPAHLQPGDRVIATQTVAGFNSPPGEAVIVANNYD